MEIDTTKILKKGVVLSVVIFLLLILTVSYIGVHEVKTSNTFTISNGHLVHRKKTLQAPNALIIQEIHVIEGDQLAQGDLLVTVKNIFTDEELLHLQKNVEIAQSTLRQLQYGGRDVTTNVSSARDTLEAAHSRMVRMNELYALGAVSAAKRNEAVEAYEQAKSSETAAIGQKVSTADPKAVQVAEAQLKKAERALETAQKATETTQIHLHNQGIVSRIFVKEGDQLEKGNDILVIDDVGDSWIEVLMEQNEGNNVYLGQIVRYELNGVSMEGTIEEITDIPTKNEKDKIAGKQIFISVPPEILSSNEENDNIVLHFSS